MNKIILSLIFNANSVKFNVDIMLNTLAKHKYHLGCRLDLCASALL